VYSAAFCCFFWTQIVYSTGSALTMDKTSAAVEYCSSSLHFAALHTIRNATSIIMRA